MDTEERPDKRRIEKAEAVLRMGANVNQAATASGLSWYQVDKLKKEMLASGRLTATAGTEPAESETVDAAGEVESSAAETERPSAAEDEEPAEWDVTLQIPVAQADRFIGQFTVAEKMRAIGVVLQDRMDALMEVETEGRPQ